MLSRFKGIISSVILLICANYSFAQLVLVAGTEFEPTTIDASKTFYGINEIRTYGLNAGIFNVTPALATSTDPDDFHTSYQYAITDNPFNLDDIRYADLTGAEQWGLVASPSTFGNGNRDHIINISLSGLSPNSNWRVEVEYSHPLSTTYVSCNENVSVLGVGNPDTPGNSFNGRSSANISKESSGTFTFDQNDSNSGQVDGSGNLAIFLNTEVNRDCRPIVINKIEVFAEPDPEIFSPDGDEVCAGEQITVQLRQNLDAALQWQVDEGSGFTDIAGGTNAAILYETMAEQSYDFRLRITPPSGTPFFSDVLSLNAITCCQINGQPASRTTVYYDDFGRIDLSDPSGRTFIVQDYTDILNPQEVLETTTTPFRRDLVPPPYPDSPGAISFAATGPVNTDLYTVAAFMNKSNPILFNGVSYAGAQLQWSNVINGLTSDPQIGYDHSGELEGAALLINVPANTLGDVIYRRQIDNLCVGKTLFFECWIAVFTRTANGPYEGVNVELRLTDPNNPGTPVTVTGTANRQADGGGVWVKISTEITLQPGPNNFLIAEIINNQAATDNGNDLVIDDIKILACAPPSIKAFFDLATLETETEVCSDNLEISVQSSDFLNNFYGGMANIRYLYQWSRTPNDVTSWTNIGSPQNNAQISISDPQNNVAFAGLSDGDEVYFRVIVANDGIFSANSNFTSVNANINDPCRNYSVSEPIEATLNCPACSKPDAVSISNGASVTQCLNSSLDLSGGFTPGANPIQTSMNYVWYKQGEAVGAYSAVPGTNLIPDESFSNLVSADSGTWVLRVEDGAVGNANCYTEATIDVEIYDVPTATLSGDTTICGQTGVEATLNLVLTGSQPWTVVYDDPEDGNTTLTPNLLSSPATFNVSNDGIYSLVSLSDANCPGTVSGSATVGYHPEVTASTELRCSDDTPLGGIALNSNEFQIIVTINTGDLVSVNITETTAFGITFTRDGSTNNWYSTAVNEANSIDINVTDANNCNGGQSITGLTTSCSCPASADVFFSASGTLVDSICSTGTSALTVNASGGSGNYDIQLTQPDATTQGLSNVVAGNFVFNVSQSGNYTVLVTSLGDANCVVPGNTVSVGIYDNPTGELAGDFKICADSTDTLNIDINVTSRYFPVDVVVNRTVGGDTTITLASTSGSIPGTLANVYNITSIEDNNGCLAEASDITGPAIIDTVTPPSAFIFSVDGDTALQINMTSFKEKYTNATMVEVVADSISDAFVGTWTLDGAQGDTTDTKQDTVSVMGLVDLAMLPDTSFGDAGITRLVYSVVDTAGVCDAVTDTLKIIKVEGGPLVGAYDINICTDEGGFTQNGRTLITGIETGVWVDINGIIPGAPADDTIRSNDINFPANITPGTYTFNYVVKSILEDVDDQVTIVTLNVSAMPNVVPENLAPLTTCDDNISLNAMPLTSGNTGLWTKISGTGDLIPLEITLPDATVENLVNTESGEFRWVVSNGFCTNRDTSEVMVTRTGNLSSATIFYKGGLIEDDSTITICNNAIESISNGGFAVGETGIWTMIDPPSAPRSVTINEDDSQTQSLILNSDGITTLQWSVIDPAGICNPNPTTVNINVIPPPNPLLDMDGKSDTTICFGETINLLTTNLSGGDYQWFVNNNPVASQTGPNYQLVGTAAEYRFEESNGFCSASTLPIRVIVDAVPDVNAGSPTILEEEDVRFLGGTVDIGDPTWSIVLGSTNKNIIKNVNDLNSEIISINTGGNYTLRLTARNNNCVAFDETTVNIRTKVKAPNVFTPNGDDDNEFFVIDGLETYPMSKMYIYSRWGKAVYISPTDFYNDELWDGGDLPDGVYYYTIDLGLGKENGHSGVIHLVR